MLTRCVIALLAIIGTSAHAQDSDDQEQKLLRYLADARELATGDAPIDRVAALARPCGLRKQDWVDTLEMRLWSHIPKDPDHALSADGQDEVTLSHIVTGIVDAFEAEARKTLREQGCVKACAGLAKSQAMKDADRLVKETDSPDFLKGLGGID